MKIRDLDLDQYVVVKDLGAGKYSSGMRVIGKVVEIDPCGNFAVISSLPDHNYEITDFNDFELWSKEIEDKTEHIAFDKENTKKAKKLLSNDLQQRKRNNNKINISQLKPGDHVKVKNSEGFRKGKVIATPKAKSELNLVSLDLVSIRDDYDEEIFFIDNTFEIELIQRNDTVNHPSHYNYGDIEVINFIEQVTKHYNPNVAYHIGNAIKYLARSPHKNGKEDVAKAKWYIERAFENWDK